VIASPCRRNCCLDLQDVCLGCGRTYQEIIAWHTADDAGRSAILAAAAQRLHQKQQTPSSVPRQSNLDDSN
jgi:predicted Fe-S protein YdhL (DUF1289 family)